MLLGRRPWCFRHLFHKEGGGALSLFLTWRRVGVHWRVGDVLRFLVIFNRACCIGLATVSVAGRPEGVEGILSVSSSV